MATHYTDEVTDRQRARLNIYSQADSQVYLTLP